MKIRTSRPSGDDNDRNTEDKKYRAEVISLSMGGLHAKIGQYIGADIVMMRIMPRITNVRGTKKISYSLDGFDPDTGKWVMIFFDTRIRNGGDGYVKNFGGGLAATLGTAMTEEEFEDAVDIINAENETDFSFNYSDWETVGGPIKLKAKYRGKPMTIGKRFIETEGGNNMNIFLYDPLDPADYPNLQQDIESYESLEGVPYDPEIEEEEADEASLDSGSDEEVVVETPAKKEVETPARSSRRVVSKSSRAARSNEVSREFELPQTEGTEILKIINSSVDIPDNVREMIEAGYTNKLSTDQIILSLIQDLELSERQAVDSVEAWLDSRPGKGRAQPTEKKKAGRAAPAQADSEIVTAAKECKTKQLDAPASYDILNKKFPDVSREEKRAALKTAGIIKY